MIPQLDDLYHCLYTSCSVNVSTPWEALTFVPQGSYVTVNCSDESDFVSQNNLEWSIRLPDRQVEDSFTGIRIGILNDRGFFELPALTFGSQMVIQLEINKTDGINGTVLKCQNISSGNVIGVTTIIVYG